MSTAKKPLAFTSDQKNSLLKLGLLQSQINEVELILPLAKAYIQEQPPRTDVHDRLTSTSDALKLASKKLSKLLDADPSAAAQEAWYRTLVADAMLNNHADSETIREAIDGLAAAGTVVQRALSDLPPGQRRHRAASPLPIRHVDGALLRGFVKFHSGRLMPPYLLRPSASPGSAYRSIIGICYEAMGQNTDPERALKAFIKDRKLFLRLANRSSKTKRTAGGRRI